LKETYKIKTMAEEQKVTFLAYVRTPLLQKQNVILNQNSSQIILLKTQISLYLNVKQAEYQSGYQH
jgi:hypothetical protein